MSFPFNYFLVLETEVFVTEVFEMRKMLQIDSTTFLGSKTRFWAGFCRVRKMLQIEGVNRGALPIWVDNTQQIFQWQISMNHLAVSSPVP